MKRKHLATLVIIVLVLAALVYLQVREWRRFDWATFKENISDIDWSQILVGVALIHLADFLRAIRWKIFLRPTSPQTSWKSLVAPQYVGFAGLALLGRPGELIRPYLISVRAKTAFSSQMALWFVERAFDTGAVALVLAIDLFTIPQIRRDYSELNKFGYAGIALLVTLLFLWYSLWKQGPTIADWLASRIQGISASLAEDVRHKIVSASRGLHAIHDMRSFLQATGISFVIWLIVALAYRQVMHAFSPNTGLSDFGLPQGIILMGSSVVGGVLQLPFIGGGAQVATTFILINSFDIQPEAAAAASVMFWLVMFMSVAPLGLILARFEHVSIRKLTQQSETEAHREDVADHTSEPA